MTNPTKIKVKTIKMADKLTPGEMDKICREFGVTPPKGNAKQKGSKLKHLLSTSSKLFKIVSNSDIKSNINDLYYCFSTDGTFVCTQLELRSRLHSIIIPENTGKVTTSAFSYRDRIKLLMQLSLSDINGMVTLPWSHLTANQMVVAAAMFDVKADIKEIRKRPDIAEKIPSEIFKSKAYTDQFGKSKEKNPLFYFWLDDLETCTGVGHDGEDMLKLVLPNQKVLQGPALNISEDVDTISNPKSTTEVQCPITPPSAKVPCTKTAECESEVSLSSMDNIQNNKQNGSMTLNSTNVLTKQTPLTTGANLITHVELAPTDPPVSVYDINMADSATMDQQETEIRDKSGKQPIISALAETPSKGSNPNKRKKNTPIKDINTEVNNGILAPVSPSVAINKKK